MPKEKGLIFDFDNTMAPCSEFYADAATTFARLMRRIFPERKSRDISQLFTEMDLNAATQKGGFGRLRFPTSMVDTYEVLCKEHGMKPDEEVKNKAFRIGLSVFEMDYPLFEGVREMLEAYKEEGYRLALCTKGDPVEQQKKIDHNDIGHLFDVKEIVPHKSEKEILRVADRLGFEKRNLDSVFMIGDSLRDDILSAQRAGVGTVWINREFRRSWNWDDVEPPIEPDYVIGSVVELPEIFPLKRRLDQRKEVSGTARGRRGR